MRLVLFCLLCWVLPAARASVVTQTVRPNIVASATYMVGDADKPAILLVHGFLQTRSFPTVASLGDGLHDAGYTVLLPTLSLNIPSRGQSLACEAIHRHSLDDDVDEIGRWVLWLKAQGHRSIVLLGHSFGSLQSLAYLTGRPDPAVKAYVGTSLIEAQMGTGDRRGLTAQLEDRIHRQPRELVNQSLSYCKKYTTTPEALLSYVRWDQTRTLAAMRQVALPNLLIMGDSDSMVSHNWLKALQHVRARMVVVKGANHFMDGEHEFDLLQSTLDFLASLNATPAR
jgi:pimeloyl-ACP methyl ester carboxylesterase